MNMSRYSGGAGRIALSAMLTALSLVFLYGASVAPSGQLGLAAAAGVFPAAALVSGGAPAGFLCYTVTGLLGLLLVPNKSGVLLYILFFGLYPLLKHWIEKIKKLPLEWLCKLLLCNAALGLFWNVLRTLLLAGLPAVFGKLWVFWLAGTGAFVLYDVGFSKVMSFYVARVHRVIFRQ